MPATSIAPAFVAPTSSMSATGFSISRLTAAASKRALPAERALFVAAFRDVYDYLPPATLGLAPSQTVPAFLHAAFDDEEAAFKTARPTVRFYVARHGADLVGYLSVTVDCNAMYLRQMAVSTAWQRRGVGRQLIETAVREGGKDVRVVSVAVRRFNDAAKTFYTRLGFREGGGVGALNPDLYCGMRMEKGSKAGPGLLSALLPVVIAVGLWTLRAGV